MTRHLPMRDSSLQILPEFDTVGCQSGDLARFTFAPMKHDYRLAIIRGVGKSSERQGYNR